MRSFIVTAAMAALLAATPLVAYAAPHHSAGGFHDGSHGGSGFHGRHGRDGSIGYFGDGFINDEYPGWDSVYNDYYVPGYNPGYYSGGYAAPAYVPNSRLNAVLGDLRSADHRIAVDRAHGLLRPAQAASLRSRDAAIRREALNVAAREGGMLTGPSYQTLLHQTRDLDRTIAYDAGS